MSVIPAVRSAPAAVRSQIVRCSWCGEVAFAVLVLGEAPAESRFVRCRGCTVNNHLLADLVDARSGGFPPRIRQPPPPPEPVDRRTCVSSKVFYPNETAAFVGLSTWRRRRRAGQAHGQIYDCPWCPGWHLTSGKTRRRTNSARAVRR